MWVAFFAVNGRSMEPTMLDGDFVVATKTSTLRRGFLVVAQHKNLGRIIKRIERIEGDSVWLQGDNLSSTSSEDMGAFTPAQITHRVRFIVQKSGIKRAR